MDPAWFQVHTATPNLARGAEPTPGPRGIIAGGRVSAPAFSDLIEYVNISSMGNAVDFNANEDLMQEVEVLQLLHQLEEYS